MKLSSSPRFTGLSPKSHKASKLAAAASKKRDTRCELALRAALSSLKLRYRLHVRELPGRPDVIFTKRRVVVFVDGDFWHGRDLEARIARLRRGHNGPYWTRKLRRNVERDRLNNARLRRDGWRVIRVWESDVLRDPERVARRIARVVGPRDPADRHVV